MAPASLDELAGPGVAATFVAADPPRDGWLALWAFDPAVPGAAGDRATTRRLAPDTEVELALPSGAGVRRRRVRARRVPLADVVGDLVELRAGDRAGRSLPVWAAATRLAVELVARGRLEPGRSPTGHDAWRLGPLDPDDRQRRTELARALPPEAHAVARPGR
ncbi:MAG: hypothetical protein KDB35_12185, partial [Acidimicrobiales bacterium]|nr:hypothetical protein [Acidimicrobiales bacterium]